MASNHFLAFAILAIFVPSLAMATRHVVGDDKGWALNVDYKAWANDKTFYVGDTLEFHYKTPNHNVFKVDDAGFKDCNPSGQPLTSGNDTIFLQSPGKKWYICGQGDHCDNGLKLSITVESVGPVPGPSPVPGPLPVPSTPKGVAHGLAVSWYQIFVAAVVAMTAIVV